MSSSADSTSSQFLHAAPLPGLLNGKPFHGSASYVVKDPHNPSKTLHQVSSITVQDVPAVIDVAQKAFKSWKNSSVIERRNIFIRAGQILRERIPELAKIEFEETTSSEGWAGFEMTLAADSIEETAAAATNALRGEIATTDSHQRAYIERCPYGVVLGMAPWNAPLTLCQRAVLQPIMAGNTAILKTSEMSPRTHMILAEVMQQAGLPAGVLSIVHVAPEDAPGVVEAFIKHDAVGKVNFTGSTRVGSIVASLCGKYIKPVVLELGGKAPAIVCEDADLELAANAIKFGGLFHSGQICMATQTAIVHESVVDKFLELLTDKYPRASADPTDGAALRGLFTTVSANRVKEIVDDALSKGAKIVAGEHKVEGNVVQPVLLANVTEEMRVYREEMFAPVFSVLTFSDYEKAIHYANDHDYGLAASVFSKDIDRAYKLAKDKSGFGRFNGLVGIREFCQLKTITIDEKATYPAPSA